MRRPPATLVGAAQELVPALRQLDLTEPVTARRLASALGWAADSFEVHAGFRFYLAPDHFKPVTGAARLVRAGERAEVQALLAACAPDEVRESELDADLPVLVGVWERGLLCAVAGFYSYGNLIADVRAIVHPEHRRRGLARQAVSALCRQGPAAGRLIQYECADWNHASLAVARSLGFQCYAKVELALPLAAAAH